MTQKRRIHKLPHYNNCSLVILYFSCYRYLVHKVCKYDIYCDHVNLYLQKLLSFGKHQQWRKSDGSTNCLTIGNLQYSDSLILLQSAQILRAYCVRAGRRAAIQPALFEWPRPASAPLLDLRPCLSKPPLATRLMSTHRNNTTLYFYY